MTTRAELVGQRPSVGRLPLVSGPGSEPRLAMTALDVGATFLAHSRRCYLIALRVVKDPHLAEDVVQDVFESLCDSRASFDPERGSLPAWLSVVTHHSAVDLVRHRERRVRLDVGVTQALDVPDGRLDPAELATANDYSSRLRRAVAELPPLHQSVIQLAYGDEYTREEIAHLLHVPPGTVKSRIFYALRSLADAMDDTQLDDCVGLD